MANVYISTQIAEIDRKLEELKREKKRLKIERYQLVIYQKHRAAELQRNVEHIGG